MSNRVSRRFWRKVGVVCGLGVSLLWGSRDANATEPTPPARELSGVRPSRGAAEIPAELPAATRQSLAAVAALAGQPVWLPPEGGRPGVLAYPPRDTKAPARITVMLHGMCDTPQNECPHFASSVTTNQWLICPRADVECSNGGSMWGWRTRQRAVESGIERIEQMFPGALDDATGRTLVGFSLGSFAAVDIAHKGGGKWKYVVLLGAKIEPNARLLERAGVSRVLLGSGDFDMMKWHMVEQSRRLDRAGMPSTYMSMGRVGHWFAPDMDAWMSGALAWLHAGESNSEIPEPVASR
jgi:predicted esterase